MSLVHKQIAWGCIVGVTLLGCLAGVYGDEGL